MKNKSLTLIIILVLTLFCQNLFCQETEIDITAEITKGEEIPGVYYEYNAADKDIAGKVRGLVEKFNSYTETSLEVKKVSSPRPYINNGSEYFEMYSIISGAFIWSKDLNAYVNQSETENLPVESMAEEKAKDHIKKLDLIPKNMNEMVLAHVGGSAISFYNPETKAVENYEKLRNVTFTRKLKGYDIVGGMRIVVSMGTDGELVSLINNWPELSTKKVEKAVKSNGNLKDKAKGYLKAHYKGSKVKSVKVAESKLVMYDDGNGIVEPALYLKGNILHDDGVVENGDWIVPVLETPKGKYNIIGKDVPVQNREDVEPVEDNVKDDELR